ncbi:MAG: hypothetical protein JST48_05750 [Bacteroidetes bacterium]|nr:hypothetical protein [Bacteroidota bacterium]
MKSLLIIVSILLTPHASEIQQVDERERLKLLSDFVTSLRNSKISINEIDFKFLPPSAFQDKTDLKLRLLNELRTEIQKSDSLNIVNYPKADKELAESFEDSPIYHDNLFFIFNKNIFITSVLISDGKIISISSIRKSGHRHLVLLN